MRHQSLQDLDSFVSRKTGILPILTNTVRFFLRIHRRGIVGVLPRDKDE